jgi:hypothetical protein
MMQESSQKVGARKIANGSDFLNRGFVAQFVE